MPGSATERAFTANFTWYMFFSCVVAASGGAVSLPAGKGLLLWIRPSVIKQRSSQFLLNCTR